MSAAVQIQEGIFNLKLASPRFLLAFSGRQFTSTSYPDFLGNLGISPESFVRVKQVHGKKIVLVKEARGYQIEEADGLVTQTPGLALGILTADCVPVFFWAEEVPAVSLIHAGWRGLHQGILESAMRLLTGQYQARTQKIFVALGPAIRDCCYEVGPEFLDYFPKNCRKEGSRHRMNLIQEARDRLLACGINPAQIHDLEICTVCQNSRFFSARKEKTCERILSVIQIRKLV